MRSQDLQSLVLALTLLAPGGLWASEEIEAADEAVADTQIGLVKSSVFEVPSPEPFAAEAGLPGEQEPLPRAYPGAPPRISHAVADFLPISRQENLCLDCHEPQGEKGEGLPTPPPASHRTDLRNAPDKVGQGIVGARYVCVSCHVPETGAKPLVENQFGIGE
jgi:cytochrome c-type protein NapB